MLKKYRILLLLGGIFSCLFSMSMIFESRVFFRNMYTDHFVYDFNLYSQIISVGLLGVLLLLLLIKKTKPYFFTVVGIITILINVAGMILYSSVVEEFYFSIYSIRGIILLLIGVFLQSNNLVYVKRLSLYFFLELLVLQVSSMSEDSIFYMYKTFEFTNVFGTVILFSLGLLIPLCMNYFLIEVHDISNDKIRKPINTKNLVKITSWISIGYLIILVIMNIPYLFAILVDADRTTIFYYQISAMLRILLFLLLIYSLICVTRDSVKIWLLPAITITIIVTIIFPLTINIQFYLDRFYWLYGVIFDLVLLIVMTIFIYVRKYKISFLLSIWFLLNFLLAPLLLGNLQTMIIFKNIAFRNLEIFVQILYYFLPATLILVLYNRMKNQKEES